MRQATILLLLFVATAAHAQLAVNFTVDVSRDTASISPYIYGINWVHAGEELHEDWNLASRRLGGNRLSSYNWEVNASNSGNDCDATCRNQNDNWLTYRLPIGDQNIPALLPRRFHEDSQELGAYSLVQLQAAGYVAADRNETVRPVPPAPSPRWKEVRFSKGEPFSMSPDPNDGAVYMDEQVNYLVTTFGNAANGGVQGYSIDNEPGLWYTSHPRLRGLGYNSADEVLQAEGNGVQAVKDAKASPTEVIDKSIALAKAVKAVDPGAEIFGPAFWGFLDYYSLQESPGWDAFRNEYGIYLNMYLARMKAAEQEAGRRLLDVVDLHWYPQMGETPEKIMQAPRSLWDATYKEDSWIARDVLQAPINLFPTLKASIAQHYPGTKLAITEFRFGDASNGNTYYSGIAVADALGIFGRDGIYMAHYHPTDLDAPIAGYVAAAYKIYRNYDGTMSTFGDVSTHATTSDVENSSIYAALDRGDRGQLHLIVINRNMTQPIAGTFTIAGGRSYTSASVWAYDNTSSAITQRTGLASIAGNSFNYSIPPLTVAHIVLSGSSSGVDDNAERGGITLDQVRPNPVSREASVRFHLSRRSHATLTLFDALGRSVATLADGIFEPGAHTARFALDDSRETLSEGLYFCRLNAGGVVRSVPVIVNHEGF